MEEIMGMESHSFLNPHKLPAPDNKGYDDAEKRVSPFKTYKPVRMQKI